MREDWTAFQADIFASGEVAAGTLNATSSGLSLLVDQPFVFVANVDQEVPIVASIPFRRTIEVPINASIPINEIIETTITVGGPFGWDVDVDVTVPLDLIVPVNLTVPIEIDEIIEVDTSTRLQLSVPVELDLEESGLAVLVRQMSNNLTISGQLHPHGGLAERQGLSRVESLRFDDASRSCPAGGRCVPAMLHHGLSPALEDFCVHVIIHLGCSFYEEGTAHLAPGHRQPMPRFGAAALVCTARSTVPGHARRR